MGRGFNSHIKHNASHNVLKPRYQSRYVVAKMFTGIVQGMANVSSITDKTDVISYDISFPKDTVEGITIGASVALNGTCLTVVAADGDVLSFDLIPETLACTNLGNLTSGSAVNFERSVKYGDEVGGHNVSGHVHTTAEIIHLERQEENATLKFQLKDPKWIKFIMPKGFIAVDGCSLTVGEVGEDWFTVYLIPETLRVTVLGMKKEGDSVNIEIDAQTMTIVNTVERVLQSMVQKA